MDKVVNLVKRKRELWWDAIRVSVSLRGYKYYKPPPEIKYRYPAPGSVPHTREDRENLYKVDWKIPFRDSPYNVRDKEIQEDEHDWHKQMYATPDLLFDPEDPWEAARMRDPLIDPLAPDDRVEYLEPDSFDPEKASQQIFEDINDAIPKYVKEHVEEFEQWNHGEDDYNPQYHLFRERGFTGIEHDSHTKQVYLELEHLLEDVFAAKRIREKKMEVYKGTVKKWQVLDDAVVDREQVRIMQAAIKAPMPEELEQYKAEGERPMTLPITNENVYKWRDEPNSLDSADFSSKLVELDRERGRAYFMDRYQRPKELQK